ncbi:hypothetical protein PR202_ga18125 [Eleusine coracana subsp. coracana]|uniref:Uncharacterized protein n=1 Tax=Eleusine coracana subsp. coracana TaxID=191504 RepID=A0AAV5CSC6_ELECO|nr:hypothetical protein PR202_ga18125 [Eleusine coracana subsp. coracana]
MVKITSECPVTRQPFQVGVWLQHSGPPSPGEGETRPSPARSPKETGDLPPTPEGGGGGENRSQGRAAGETGQAPSKGHSQRLLARDVKDKKVKSLMGMGFAEAIAQMAVTKCGAEVALHRLGIHMKTVVSVEKSEVSRGVLKSWFIFDTDLSCAGFMTLKSWNEDDSFNFGEVQNMASAAAFKYVRCKRARVLLAHSQRKVFEEFGKRSVGAPAAKDIP